MGYFETHGQMLAHHLRSLRSDRGMTLQELALHSQVSRATLSRIETGEVSPTVETLGRLAPLEQDFQPLMRHAEQSVWSDPDHDFFRRLLSPPSKQLKFEMIECEIGHHQCIAYERPAFPGHEHHLVLLSGVLTLTIEKVVYELYPGDCLRYRLNGASSFKTGDQAARYILAMA